MRIPGKSEMITAGKLSPERKILQGELLGDVVEQITGKDLRIHRFGFGRAKHHKGKSICRHQTKAYAGRFLVGTAHVVWIGSVADYTKLIRQRMRTVLKVNNAKPVILSANRVKGTICRTFNLQTPKGELHIQENVDFRRLELLSRATQSRMGFPNLKQ